MTQNSFFYNFLPLTLCHINTLDINTTAADALQLAGHQSSDVESSRNGCKATCSMMMMNENVIL